MPSRLVATTRRCGCLTFERIKSWPCTRTTTSSAASPRSHSQSPDDYSWQDTTTSTATSGTAYGRREQVFWPATTTVWAALAWPRTAWPSAPDPGTASWKYGTKWEIKTFQNKYPPIWTIRWQQSKIQKTIFVRESKWCSTYPIYNLHEKKRFDVTLHKKKESSCKTAATRRWQHRTNQRSSMKTKSIQAKNWNWKKRVECWLFKTEWTQFRRGSPFDSKKTWEKRPNKKQEETTQQKSLSFSYFNFVHFIEIYAKKVVFTPAQNRNRLWTKAQTWWRVNRKPKPHTIKQFMFAFIPSPFMKSHLPRQISIKKVI